MTKEDDNNAIYPTNSDSNATPDKKEENVL